jgi:hypothetical protein
LAVIRCAIDGDLELATLELREDISVPRQALQKHCDNRSPSETETDVKAQVAAAMAIEMAWAVLEPYINVTLNIEPNEVDTVKQKIVDILVSLAEY